MGSFPPVPCGPNKVRNIFQFTIMIRFSSEMIEILLVKSDPMVQIYVLGFGNEFYLSVPLEVALQNLFSVPNCYGF